MQNRNRKGFTLIELLIVVVIIGILAAIAIPKFANTKAKAYSATMKGDLRNLATAQEGYASDNSGAYIPAGTATAAAPNNGYSPSSGVTVTIIAPTANPPGWSASAVHSASNKACYIWAGDTKPGGAPAYSADASGEPACQS